MFHQPVSVHVNRDKFSTNTMESNMEALTAISALLQGPYEVGTDLLNKEGVMQVMVAMAASQDTLHQVRIALYRLKSSRHIHVQNF